MNPVEQYREKRAMEDDTAKAEISAFINSLGPDDLQVFIRIINSACLDSDIGYLVEGVATGALMFKYGYSWNGNETPWTGQQEAAQSTDTTVPPSREVATHGEIKSASTKGEVIEIPLELMERYGLEIKNGYLYCIGCGTRYISLDDRMLRPAGPAGCKGCAEKAKWG